MFAFIALAALQAAPAAAEPPKLTSITLLAPGERLDQAPMPLIPEGPEPKAPHRARANLLTLFSWKDYPAEALEKGEQGSVRVELAVSAEGVITACTVLQSSKSESLDRTTCEILRTRGKFQPALDAKGNRVADTHQQTVRWMLPETPQMPVETKRNRTFLTFGADGNLANCRNDPTPPSPFDKERCDLMLTVAKDWFGAAGVLNRTVTFEDGFLLGGAEALAPVGSGPNDTLISRSGFALTIAADGSISDCARAEGGGPDAAVTAACEKIKAMRFVPSLNTGERKLVTYTAIYFAAPAK